MLQSLQSGPLNYNAPCDDDCISHELHDGDAQIVEVLEQGQKDGRLDAVLQKHRGGKQRVLVFVLYKKEAARVEAQLLRKGWKVCMPSGQSCSTDAALLLAQCLTGAHALCRSCAMDASQSMHRR